MSVPRGTETTMLSGRAQSTLIGIVLLIGMVAIGSLGIFLVASDMLTDVEQESEHDRVENSFVELSQQMETASSDDDVSRSMDIDAGEDGAVVMSNTGNLTIEGGDVNKTIPIGAIEYTGDDGTKIAYQAGGVFRETGNETRVVSAPPINYDADSEALSFPIIKTRDEAQLDSGNIHVSHHKTNPLQEASLVENDTVTIEVESEYYRGWEAYFKQQGGATTVQNVEVHDDNRGTVTAEFGYIEGEAVFDSGITVSEPPGEDGNVDINETDFKVRHHSMQELDDVIDDLVDDKNSSEYWVSSDKPWSIDGGETLTHTDSPNGTYFADNIDIDGDYSQIDVSHGNVTIILDGSIEIDGNNNYDDEEGLLVNGTEGNDHVVRLYLTENISVEGGGVGPSTVGEDLDAERFQVYGTSETSFKMTGGGFEGLIYAPSNNYSGTDDGRCSWQQACLHSNPSYYGGLYVSSVYYQGGNEVNFEYDESLEDAEIDIYPDGYTLPPQLTYLNVAEHKVDVEGN
ncbi:DUF7289 family protein [Natronorubrum bangense]|nr:hypothetical protein [Natronorubrum bangense]